MLDKSFLRVFFNQIDGSTDVELELKIAEVEKHMKSFPKGCEAISDARFMLKHLRREMLERQFKPAATTPRGD